MRDPERIKRMLKLVEALWTRQPDLRLSQLVVNMCRASEPAPHIFYVEDDVLERELQRTLGLLDTLAIESDT